MCRKANWFGYRPRRNWHLHDWFLRTDREMERAGRRRTQVLDGLRNGRNYWEVKEEAEDHKGGKDSLSYEYREKILFSSTIQRTCYQVIIINDKKCIILSSSSSSSSSSCLVQQIKLTHGLPQKLSPGISVSG